MRDICVWAYNSEVLPVCRNARLDTTSGLSYPDGNKQGQAGWDVAVPFKTLEDLAKNLTDGVAMPRQFCGNWFQDCDPIQRGEILRLAIMAHGDQGGKLAVSGSGEQPLTAANVKDFHSTLHTIGLYTREKSTILLTGCLAGQGEEGTRLLKALSEVWPGRWVVGFTTIGYRYGGVMKRSGETCVLPGMRDTDAPAYLFANPPKWDKLWGDFDKMPWASEKSINAKVVRNGVVERCPPGEICKNDPTPIPKPSQRPHPSRLVPKK